MKKIIGIIVVVAILVLQSNYAIAASKKITKETAMKVQAVPVFTESSIKTLVIDTFNSLIEKLIPKDRLDVLMKFSTQLNYDAEKQGIQTYYIAGATDGTDTFFGATNLSAASVTTDSLEVASDLEVAGSVAVDGVSSLSSAKASTLEVGNSENPVGITIYDKTTKQPLF